MPRCGAVALFVLGGCIAQLHSSLQHEAIHAMRRIPRPLRWALVWPPLNLWLPYPLYHRSHSVHHVNFHLTHPQKDSESVYHSAAAWAGYGPVRRAVIAANQTLAFRLIAGPWLCLGNLVRSELRRFAAGDFSHSGIWFVHAVSMAPILWFVMSVSDMSLVSYLLCFVYPGMMLGALRSFTEHRWDDSPHERVAIVESNSRLRTAVSQQQPAPCASPLPDDAVVRDTRPLPPQQGRDPGRQWQLLLPRLLADRQALSVAADLRAGSSALVRSPATRDNRSFLSLMSSA